MRDAERMGGGIDASHSARARDIGIFRGSRCPMRRFRNRPISPVVINLRISIASAVSGGIGICSEKGEGLETSANIWDPPRMGGLIAEPAPSAPSENHRRRIKGEKRNLIVAK